MHPVRSSHCIHSPSAGRGFLGSRIICGMLAGLMIALSGVTAWAAETIELEQATREKCVAILRSGLRSAEFWPSIHAAEGLTLGGHGDEVIAYLKPLLPHETDDQRRCGIARELVRAGHLEAAQVMLDILAGEEDHGHIHAAESLYKVGVLGDGTAMQRAFLQQENLRWRLMAAAALGRSGDPRALKALREYLTHEEPQIRQLAAWVLGRIGNTQDVEQIRKNLAVEKDPLIAAYYENALAALGNPAGQRALAANLKSENPAIRTYAATFAGDARMTSVRDALIALLDDPNADTRYRAAQSLLVLSQPPADASDLDVLSAEEQETAADQIVYDRLAEKADQELDERRKAFEKIETEEDVARWQEERKKFFLRQIGGFPERTPLNAKVTGTLDGGDYRVEKIVYESRPDHFVTAALYLPQGSGPFPAVLIACGHSKTGKAAEYNQRLGILCAKHGMAAMCYDPIGQGERSQILTPQGEPRFSSSVAEHFLAGVGSILVGNNTAGHRIWDGIRGIDYLCERKDINPQKIGCTGCSGGGTLTSYLMALDERIVCAAPACYLTTYDRLINTIGPQDAEQNIFGQIGFGMDHADYVLMRAPRPTLICCTTGDYFAVGGTWDTFRQAKRIYTKLRHSERVDLVEDAGRHGVTSRGREAIIRWMHRWLLEKDEPVTDLDFPVWSEKELRCTPKGEVLLLPEARSVFDINSQLAADAADARRAFARLPAEEAREQVRSVAGIRTAKEIPAATVRLVESIPREGYQLRKFVITSPRGIPLPALMWTPAEPSGEFTVLLHEDGKQAAARPDLKRLVQEGQTVLAVDLTAFGETRGNKANSQMGDWKNYYMAYLLGESLVGIRGEDLIACILSPAVQTTESRTASGRPRSVNLIATGEAAIPALHAAAVEPELFKSVHLSGTVRTWTEVVATPETRNQLTNAVHGALLHYDLPQLVGLAGGKDKVTITAPATPDGKTVN